MSSIAIVSVLKSKNIRTIAISMALPIIVGGLALAAQDRYSLKVPDWLAFSEFRGYEDWAVISISENGGKIAIILGNPTMIDAYKAGVPGNGQAFPEGSKIANGSPLRRGCARCFLPGLRNRKGQQSVSDNRRLGIRPVQL